MKNIKMKNIKMKNIKMKNLLAENMRRFGTKNLKENIKTNSDFNETVKDIMDGGARGENMTDTILAELGDFYTEIYDSGDTNLIRLYNQLRMSADETPDIQRYSASKLFKYLGTTNLSEQNATEPKRLKLLLMYKDGPQKGTTARQIDVLYGYKNAIKPSSLGAVFNFEIAETSGKRHVGRYVCRSGKIEVLATGPRPVDSTTNRPVDSRSSLPTGIYMISAKAKELMEAITGCSDYVFNDTDVSTTNYV
jgi:hypothetical protein